MLYLIANLKSRSGYAKVIWNQVKKVLMEEKVEYNVYFTEYKGHATELAKKITEDKDRVKLVALGGDGTINEVINGIQNYSKVVFGYIPTGSSNDFARSLKLPVKPREAILNIIKPKYFERIDIGELQINGSKRNFAVSCGIGFDAAICEEAMDSRVKDALNRVRLGKLTYVGIALKQLAKFQKQGVDIVLDDVTKVNFRDIFFISSHIHKYEGGGLMLCPEAKFNDGLLDICVVGNMSKSRVLLLLPKSYGGNHTKNKNIDILRCKKLTLKVAKPIPVHTDGEYLGVQSEITIRCLKEKLTIVAGVM
jgi:YegS/Rv2252/BmrU family lipid kinase